MTLAEKYNEAMERLTLSPEARERILRAAVRQSKPSGGKVIAFPQWKRWAAVAACAAVAVLAAFMLQPPRQTAPDGALPSEDMTIANGIVDHASARELSDAVGFPVPELAELPFEVQQTAYASYWGEMAQIEYDGAERHVLLRVQPGSEDVSGDYNDYPSVVGETVNGCPVTFKGGDGAVALALWTNGGYSYSVAADPSLAPEEMTALIAPLIP